MYVFVFFTKNVIGNKESVIRGIAFPGNYTGNVKNRHSSMVLFSFQNTAVKKRIKARKQMLLH